MITTCGSVRKVSLKIASSTCAIRLREQRATASRRPRPTPATMTQSATCTVTQKPATMLGSASRMTATLKKLSRIRSTASSSRKLGRAARDRPAHPSLAGGRMGDVGEALHAGRAIALIDGDERRVGLGRLAVPFLVEGGEAAVELHALDRKSKRLNSRHSCAPRIQFSS